MSERTDRIRGFLTDRKKSYQLTFRGTPASDTVLRDLMVFCRGLESPHVPGDRDKTFILIGRQQVIQRITEHLNLTVDQLYRLYGGIPQTIPKGQE